MNDFPQYIQDIFASDERIVRIRTYPEGFVANAYKYRCDRLTVDYFRDGVKGQYLYDAKRSHGRGPNWVAFSKRNGRLASG